MKTTLFALCLILICTGCSNNRRAVNSPSFGDGYSTSLKTREVNSESVKNSDIQERVVIYNATIDLEIKRPADSINNQLKILAEKYEGYVLSVSETKSVIRVKSEKLNDAIFDFSSLGKIKSKRISGDDVTEQYFDYKIRLENAYNARKRYLQLLERAENVEAALKVEKELERLNGEIDSLEGKINRLNHLSEFSTITVNLSEKVKPGLLGYIGIGLYKSVKWLFVRN